MDREEKWQKHWKEQHAFLAKPEGPKFFITVPYPYISGSLHIGHARVVTEADVVARYQRMTGKSVLYPMAFHISGTPVLGISLAIKNGDEKKIELYRGYVRQYITNEHEVDKIVKSFEDPVKIVEFFIPRMQEEFQILGLSVDWRRSYTSGDIEHQALVEWQFRKYKEQGYLKQGSYPILYSTTLQNAVGEDDIAEGDTNPVDVQEFTLIKFKFRNSYLVAATLRPETMFGQTNLWVNPHVTYVKIQVGDEHWIVSQEAAEKLSHQGKKIEIEEEIPGKMLLGKTCFAPFVEREIPILPSTHCDPDIGTGIVTSVPSDAPFDYIALKELHSTELCHKFGIDHTLVMNIDPIPIIKSKGYGDFPAEEIVKKFNIKNLDDKKLVEATQEIYKIGFHTGIMRENAKEFAGMPVAKAKEAMKQLLLEQGKADILYETTRKAKSRDGGKVIVAVLEGQWFLDFNAPGWKNLAKQALDTMELWPEKYRQQFEDVFAWLDKRPCARRRGLGTKLPFDKDWVIESLSDSTIYMALYPIVHIIRREHMKKEQLTDAFFEFIMNKRGKFEHVAEETGVPKHVLLEMQHEWQYWYPFDQRHTFTAHLSNHLSFMIFAHAAVFAKEHWPKRISFHGMILSEGEKMSKSKGNVISLLDIKEKYGADAFRAFMCNSTLVESTFNWDSQGVEQMKRHLDQLYCVLLQIQQNKKHGTVHDKAFVSRTEGAIKRATQALERMDLREYSTIVLYEMLTDYKRAIKFSKPELVNEYIAHRWIQLLAPLIPHIAEDAWHVDEKNFVSLSKWPEYDASLIDERAELDQDYIEDIASNIRKNLQLKKIDKISSIILFQAEDWKYDFVEQYRKLFGEVKDPKQIAEKIAHNIQHHEEVLKLTFAVAKNMKLLPLIDRSPSEEKSLLEHTRKFLEEEFECTVVLGKHTDPDQKAGLPGRPGVALR